MNTKVTAAMLAADVDAKIAAAADAAVAAAIAQFPDPGKLPVDVVQVAFFQTGALGGATALIPVDDTIPQITEGTEFLTVSITPTEATSKLLVEVSMPITATAAVNVVGALFRDAAPNALAATTRYIPANAQINQITLRTMVEAGSTAATTFRVRAGAGTAATIYMNGMSNARYFGGVFNASITVTEIKA